MHIRDRFARYPKADDAAACNCPFSSRRMREHREAKSILWVTKTEVKW